MQKLSIVFKELRICEMKRYFERWLAFFLSCIALHILMYTSVFAGVTNTWPGAEGGTVQALAIDPSVNTTLYAGTKFGGVYKSTTSAASWTAVNNGLTNFNVQALAINPNPPSTLYAGTAGGGVFKSTDSGATWKLLTIAPVT